MLTDPHLLGLLAEAVATLGVVVWIRSSGRGKPESWRYTLQVMGYGVAAALIVAVAQARYLSPEAAQGTGVQSLAQGFWVAATEELGKYLAALIAITNAKHLYRLSSAITYLILVGLSFALTEDVLYFLLPTTQVIPRLLSFFIHAGTSAMIGYALGRYRFGLAKYRSLFGTVLVAILMHWSYNLAVSLFDRTQALLLTATIIAFVSSRIIVLYARTIREEYQMERSLFEEEVVTTRLLNAKPTA